MLKDAVRCEGYKKAILEVVKPGDVVADIGTGAGLLAFFSVMAGARKVYAVERGPVIEDARVIAQANGWHDRIEFVHGVSTDVELPERVDVLVSELFGSFAIEEDVIRYITDARRRFLKDDGVILPSRFDMQIAPVASEQVYRAVTGFWNSKPYGIDFSVASEMLLNRSYTVNLAKEHLLAPHQDLLTVDFLNLDTDVISIDKSLRFRAEKSGTIRGIAGWFKIYMGDNAMISTLDSKTHWRVTWFPVSRPLPVNTGEKIQIDLSCHRPFGKTAWHWSIRNEQGDSCSHTNTKHLSKLFQDPSHFTPMLRDADRTVLGFILERCTGTSSVEQISEELHTAFSDRFPSPADAMGKVIETIERIGVPSV